MGRVIEPQERLGWGPIIRKDGAVSVDEVGLKIEIEVTDNGGFLLKAGGCDYGHRVRNAYSATEWREARRVALLEVDNYFRQGDEPK